MSRPRHRANVLLVDDQPARLLTYQTILESLGQNLVTASSGREALLRLMEGEYAAVLLDVSMPDMDGFETAALIRQHPRFESTPIIFVTAVHVTDMDRLRGYEIGAVDYVYIPVIPEILRGKVQVLVDLDRQRQELHHLNNDLERMNRELREAHQQLQFDNSRQLAQLNQTLERANAELERSNAALKDEVARREQAQRRLERAAERKDQFLATLAHELRNPLAAIGNCAQLLHQPEIDPRSPWMRDMLGRQVKHLTRLVDDMLDMSRITSGRIQVHRSLLDLRTVVRHAIESIEAACNAAGHRLNVDLPAQPVMVDGDEVRLIQVVENLLANAVRYTPENGLIEVALATQTSSDGRDEAVVRVRDNGIGIDIDMLDEVFDLFTQANPTYERTQGGLGIGLALVRGIVRLHGGEVGVHSAGKGRGAEFTVRLKLAAAATVTAAPALEAEVAATAVTTRGARCVLVVDDNADASKGLTVWLRLLGYQTLHAESGDEGLRLALAARPDVVLLDLGLPKLDGFAVARGIRAQQQTRPLLIAMTGFGATADRQHARAAGFDHFLVKPIDFEVLRALLARETAPQVSTVTSAA